MGRYYAKHDGLSDDVAIAIEDHYKPRFAGDLLPRNRVGLCVALADKLETLVGMFGIGQIPTGDKDPFALRRHALGVIHCIEVLDLPTSLDLSEWLNIAIQSFKEHLLSANTPFLVENFILERQWNQLAPLYGLEIVGSVIALHPPINQIVSRVFAVREFIKLQEAAALAAANKRVGNILKKVEGEVDSEVNATLLQEPAEQALHQALSQIAPKAEAAFAKGDYTASLLNLAALRVPVDAFFDSVMVNAEDLALRANRLALLAQLHQAMNRVADLSKLAA
jgi:glycyl-tRNA synthetase beta chain